MRKLIAPILVLGGIVGLLFILTLRKPLSEGQFALARLAYVALVETASIP